MLGEGYSGGGDAPADHLEIALKARVSGFDQRGAKLRVQLLGLVDHGLIGGADGWAGAANGDSH